MNLLGFFFFYLKLLCIVDKFLVTYFIIYHGSNMNVENSQKYAEKQQCRK